MALWLCDLISLAKGSSRIEGKEVKTYPCAFCKREFPIEELIKAQTFRDKEPRFLCSECLLNFCKKRLGLV